MDTSLNQLDEKIRRPSSIRRPGEIRSREGRKQPTPPSPTPKSSISRPGDGSQEKAIDKRRERMHTSLDKLSSNQSRRLKHRESQGKVGNAGIGGLLRQLEVGDAKKVKMGDRIFKLVRNEDRRGFNLEFKLLLEYSDDYVTNARKAFQKLMIKLSKYQDLMDASQDENLIHGLPHVQQTIRSLSSHLFTPEGKVNIPKANEVIKSAKYAFQQVQTLISDLSDYRDNKDAQRLLQLLDDIKDFIDPSNQGSLTASVRAYMDKAEDQVMQKYGKDPVKIKMARMDIEDSQQIATRTGDSIRRFTLTRIK